MLVKEQEHNKSIQEPLGCLVTFSNNWSTSVLNSLDYCSFLMIPMRRNTQTETVWTDRPKRIPLSSLSLPGRPSFLYLGRWGDHVPANFHMLMSHVFFWIRIDLSKERLSEQVSMAGFRKEALQL